MTVEKYIELVYKNLKGVISSEEFAMLNRETVSNPEWADQRFELEESWDLNGESAQIVSSSETDKLFDKITNGTQAQSADQATISNKNDVKSTNSRKTETKIFTLSRVLSSIAAIAVLAFGAMFLFQDGAVTYSSPGAYTLADNSVVKLRNGSITISEFSDSERRVQLDGEAFFEISKDKTRPFRIAGNNVDVEVLGTSFLVKESGSISYVSVTEGSVRVVDKSSSENAILEAGQAVQVTDAGIEVLDKYKNLSGWKDGYYQFKNTTLVQVLDELSIVFDTEIDVEDSDLLDCDFSGNLAGESLNDLLSRIAKIHKMEIRQEGSKWILSGGNCS